MNLRRVLDELREEKRWLDVVIGELEKVSHRPSHGFVEMLSRPESVWIKLLGQDDSVCLEVSEGRAGSNAASETGTVGFGPLAKEQTPPAGGALAIFPSKRGGARVRLVLPAAARRVSNALLDC